MIIAETSPVLFDILLLYCWLYNTLVIYLVIYLSRLKMKVTLGEQY